MSRPVRERQVDAFILAATEQRRARAEALVAARPEIAEDRWARLVLGRRGWDRDANEPGGPRGWAPLLYVCHSCFASVELTRTLLDAGADPNACFENEHGKMSALYGAAGRVHDPLLTGVLLEAGASPDDGESLYRPGGETWRGDVPLRTPYQHALLRGRHELAELLAGHGARTDGLDPADLAVAAVARGERPRTPLPEALDVDQQEVVILAALRGQLDLVLELFGSGFSGVVGGSPPGTLLHHASWAGSAEVVAGLLARGADPLASTRTDYDTPLAWAALGSQHHEHPGRDHVAVGEALTDVGGRVEPRFLEVADGPPADWLERHLP